MPTEAHDHRDRPHQVELLLDREGPQVPERAEGGEGLEVGVAAGDLVPVRGVGPRRQHRTRHGGEAGQVAVDQGPDGRGCDDQCQGRQQAPRPACPERPEGDATRPAVLVEEEPGDQEAGQDEEEVDAQVAAGEGDVGLVVGDHRHHGDRP